MGKDRTEDPFEAVYEASEEGNLTIAGLPEPMEPGLYDAVFAWRATDMQIKILNLGLRWGGASDFTYSIDEMFFDAAYEGWGHWAGGELLFTWTGGHLHDSSGHSATIVAGVDDEDEKAPHRTTWWHGVFVQMMDAIYQPDQQVTIGHDRIG